MADIVVTPGSVVKGSNASITDGTIGGTALTITAGQAVYFDATTSRWLLAQADGSTAEAGESGVGIALNGGSTGQPVKVQTAGQITMGGTVVIGMGYVVSAAAGGVAPLADLVSTNKVTPLGWGITAAIISLSPMYLGVAKP